MKFPFDHIPFPQLVDLADGRLSPDDRERSLAHLSTCSQCAAEVAQLEQIIGLMRTDTFEDGPMEVVDRAVRLFAERRASPSPSRRQRLLAALRFDSAQLPLAAGVRAGQPAERQLLFNAGEHNLDVRLVQAGEAWKVSGQVLGSEASGEVELSGAAGAVRAALTELGAFRLPPVPPGSYTLTLRLASVEVEVTDLDIGT